MPDLRSTATRLGAELGCTFRDTRIDAIDAMAAELTDYYEMIDRVRPLAVETERDGNVLFVGLHGEERAHRLFLMPTTSLHLVRLFRVGTHNRSDEAWEEVDAVLREIHAEAPFSAYFADSAGYKAAFAEKVDKAAAKRFERMILDINPEAMELDDMPIGEMIHTQGVFQLWWD